MPLHHVGLLLKSTTIDVANSGINGWLGCLGLTKSSIVARSLALAKWIVFPMACFRNCSLLLESRLEIGLWQSQCEAGN